MHKAGILLILSILFTPAVFAFSGLGSGTADDPYQITNRSELEQVNDDPGAGYKLMNDIDLDPCLPGGYAYDKAVIAWHDGTSYSFTGTAFTGSFDGNGKVISNLIITVNDAVSYDDFKGLFGYLDGGIVENLGLEGGSVEGGRSRIGGLVGEIEEGDLTNCYANVVVNGYYDVGGLVGRSSGSVTNCYTTGSVNGSSNAGGLVGYNFNGNIINSYSTDTVTGDEYIGGLAGESYGEIINCYAIAEVNGNSRVGGLVGRNIYGSITLSYACGVVTGSSYFAGGVVGRNFFGRITNCYATGAVNGSSSVGGLAGDNYFGSTAGCYATGAVNGSSSVGGLAGKNYGIVKNCYATGAVTGSDAGGLVGNSNSGSITNCFWDVQTSGVGSSGDDNYGATGKTTLEMQDINTFLDAGWDFVGEISNGLCEFWQIPSGGGYPELTVLDDDFIPVALAGSGIESDPYLISDEFELGAIVHYDLNACYKMVNDVNLAGIMWSIAVIPEFGGRLDGDGRVIANMTVEGLDNLGLIGNLGPDGRVENLSLEGGSVTGSYSNVGSLVGCNYGSITNCYSTVAVSGAGYVGGLVGYNYGSITNSYITGSVDGSGSVGGLVGRNGGSIGYCYSTGEVSGSSSVGGLAGYNGGSITNCYSTGAVNGSEYVGGLVGRHSGSITSSFAIGVVTGSSNSSEVGGLVGGNESRISYSYSTGAVSGSSCVGGLIGCTSRGSITNCSSTGAVSGSSYVGGLVGDNGGGMNDMTNCYSTGQVSGNDHVGGLAGWSSGSITNSYATGEVNGSSSVGGLVGENRLSITNCYATGQVSGNDHVGGLVGENNGSITNSYATGMVTGDNYVGGLVGRNNDSVTNCFWDVQTSGFGSSGDDNYGATGKTTLEMQDVSTFLGAGWDYVNEVDNGLMDAWFQRGGEYPSLYWQAMVGDCDYDDSVGLSDLLILSGDWLSGKIVNERLLGDVSFDGRANMVDFAVIAENWPVPTP